MAEVPDAARRPAAAQTALAPPALLPERCPQCGAGRLRFDREIPAAGGAPRRYDRCTAAGCDFECMRLV